MECQLLFKYLILLYIFIIDCYEKVYLKKNVYAHILFGPC